MRFIDCYSLLSNEMTSDLLPNKVRKYSNYYIRRATEIKLRAVLKQGAVLLEVSRRDFKLRAALFENIKHIEKHKHCFLLLSPSYFFVFGKHVKVVQPVYIR